MEVHLSPWRGLTFRTSLMVVLGVTSLWLLYLAAYHAWSVGGPPSPWAEWHRAWFHRYLGLATVAAAASLASRYLPKN